MNESLTTSGDPAFACDAMLGRLARWLRVLGYRAAYFPRPDDARLVRETRAASLVLLTRDTRLVLRSSIGPHLLIRANDTFEQLVEVARAYSLSPDPARRSRVCAACNGRPSPVPRSAVRGLVPPFVYGTQAAFTRCPDCGRIYWPATHRREMDRRLGELFAS
jgi:uncharacterized protein